MRLRTIGLIGILALTFLSVRLPAEAQQAGKMARIGYLRHSHGPNARDEAFQKALRELGWVEGKNITIEYRWTAGKKGDLLDALAQELVSLKVDLIVVSTGGRVRAAMRATRTIPIVMAVAADAVENGYIASLARPGGNVTGMSEGYAEIHTKLLEVLHETLPKVTRVAFLWDPASRVYIRTFKKAQAVAPALGLMIQSLALRNAEELESLLEGAVQEKAGALVVMGRIYANLGPRIAEFAAKNRMPVFSVHIPSVTKFGMLAYAYDGTDMFRRAATYVDKILRGAKPEDLPVQRPVKFDLVVNLKTAKQIGVTIPPEVLYRADKVIK